MIIRRPLAVLFLAYTLGIGGNYIFSPAKYTYFVGFFIAVIVFIVLNLKIPSKQALLILTILLFFNTGGLVSNIELNKKDDMNGYVGQEVSSLGTGVKFQSKSKDYHKITVERDRDRYLLHVKGEGLDPQSVIGYKINFKGVVEEPSKRRNPGCFDYQLYLKTVNVRSIINCSTSDMILVPPKLNEDPVNYLYSKLTKMKCGYLDRLKTNMSKESYGLLSGMLFGSKDSMDEDIYEAFQKNGIAHILSVSGIHVGIVYGFILLLLRKRINPLTGAIILFCLFSYAFLSEFSPSVVRAGLMITIHIISKLLNKPYDLLTGTSLAALIMLLTNPLSLFHVGFQLSFLAVVLLAFFIPFLKRYVGKQKVINMLMPLVIIQLGMAPFSIYVFNYFSLSGLFMNIPIIALAGIIIPVGVGLMAVHMLNMPFLADFVLEPGIRLLNLILEVMININQRIFSMEFSSFQLTSPLGWVLLGFYGLLFFLSSEGFRILKSRKKYRASSILVAGILIIALASSTSAVCKQDKSDLVFVDVGQGDCLHVRTPSGKNILIDGGGSADYNVGKKTLLPYLLKNGVDKLDYVFVTHLHTDHFQGIRELSNYMEIDNLVTYDGNKIRPDEITDGSGIENENIIYLGKGARIKVGEGIFMDVLYPDEQSEKEYESQLAQEEDENKNSLFMKLHYKDISVLVTGDLDEEGEKLIMNELKTPATSLKSTILKVGHHGSKYSTSPDFLNFVDPKLAVIQVGKNNYGHPTPEVIEKLEDKGIMIYRNDLDGAIMFKYNKGNPRIEKMIEKEP